jgi:hypothetical protein
MPGASANLWSAIGKFNSPKWRLETFHRGFRRNMAHPPLGTAAPSAKRTQSDREDRCHHCQWNVGVGRRTFCEVCKVFKPEIQIADSLSDKPIDY